MENLAQDNDLKAIIIIFTIVSGVSALVNVLRYVRESEERLKNKTA
jgi:hypothetical protein